jgi:hypothetical protein
LNLSKAAGVSVETKEDETELGLLKIDAKAIASLGQTAVKFAKLACKMLIARANAGRLEAKPTKVFIKR